MAIQTTTYKKRLRKHSGLSPQARLVALVIADLRYEARVKHHEPLPLTVAELAAECAMSPRTLERWLKECIESGWVIGRRVFRDGRQKPNEYFLADPTDEADRRRLRSVIASEGQILTAGVAHNSRRRLRTVVRSNNKFGDDGAAPRGGVGDEQETPNRVSPEPALAVASPVEPQPQPAVSEEQLLDSLSSSRQSRLWPNGVDDQEAISDPVLVGEELAQTLDQLGIKRNSIARDWERIRYRRTVATAIRQISSEEESA